MTQIADHWWWRPGWRPGRRKYTWHITFRGATAARELAARTRDRLAGLPGLDLIPDQWLHLTTQDIAFADEISDAELDAIAAAARDRLSRAGPVPVTVGPARLAGEGILCPVAPAALLTPVRDALRAAIASVRGDDRVPGDGEWHPHMSIAYANTAGPADAFEAALSGATALSGTEGTAPMTVTAVDLIRLGRDHHLYEWDTYTTVSLGPRE